MAGPDPKELAALYSDFKIEWAKNHVSQIENIIKWLTTDTTKVVRPDQNPETGEYFLYVGPENPLLPRQLPLHMGDAIHNLNGVMDYLWSGLVRSIDPTRASKITFPRHETRTNLANALANPKGHDAAIQAAFPQAERFILGTIQPYKGGNGDLIWTLNKLDNINKHRLLIVTTNVIQFRGAWLARSADGSVISHAAGVHIKTHGPSLKMAFAAPFQIEGDPDPVIDVVFAENDILEGEPVLETLVVMVEAVQKVVKAFRETFL
jgi:hypothetical protein